MGQIISEQGVSTDPKEIETIKTWAEPTSLRELRSVLGISSYYLRFKKEFATVANFYKTADLTNPQKHKVRLDKRM